MTTLALLTATAMILSYVESLLPSVGVPGVKLGLANIAVIFALYRLGWKSALAVSVVRVFMVTLLFGSLSALLYSLAGAGLSLVVMALLRRSDRFSSVGVSVAGGVAHNAGQILMAMLLLGTIILLASLGGDAINWIFTIIGIALTCLYIYGAMQQKNAPAAPPVNPYYGQNGMNPGNPYMNQNYGGQAPNPQNPYGQAPSGQNPYNNNQNFNNDQQ